jgi:hypothetical protein
MVEGDLGGRLQLDFRPSGLNAAQRLIALDQGRSARGPTKRVKIFNC